jgi:di/tricarboxylate transporter
MLIVVGILLLAVILFISGKVRVDIAALIVLSLLAITGIISPSEAISGFSNPAVVTIWAMFIISAALSRTNIANLIGKKLLRISGSGEAKLITVIMLTSGLLSFFMNNIGVAALMLPVVISISRLTRVPPSRLLMPMAYGVLLGGLTTLLTTINLLVSETLRLEGFTPFGLFDFAPVGIFAFIGGIIFTIAVGRKILPKTDPVREAMGDERELIKQYALTERTCVMRIPKGSYIANKTILDVNLGSVTGLTVLAIIRRGETFLAPDPSSTLREYDKLIIGGRLERFNEFRGWQHLVYETEESMNKMIISDHISLAEITIPEDSSLIKSTLYELNFRKQFGVNVLALKRGSEIKRSNLASIQLEKNDSLLIQGAAEKLEDLKENSSFIYYRDEQNNNLYAEYNLHERIFIVSVPKDSELIEKTLAKSRMGATFGVRVLAILRDEQKIAMPDPEEILKEGDRLVIAGKVEDLDILKALQELEVQDEAAAASVSLESEQVGLIEAMLSPRSSLVGKSLRDIHFRGKYGLQVIAIWREGRAYRTNLRDMQLQFGDALLILGKWDKIKMFRNESDFLVLTQAISDMPLSKKAPIAAGILAAMLIPVIFGLIHISIAAIAGATLLIITGCLTMDEAYKAIDWKSVFLIAGLLPLGLAMQKTGLANEAASAVVNFSGVLGEWGIVIAIYIFITIGAAIIPSAALVVMMAPVILTISSQTGISPHALMMTLAVSASASFLSPISHPANILVMGPGGYKISDYFKLGLPLTLVVMVIGLIMISIVWPF